MLRKNLQKHMKVIKRETLNHIDMRKVDRFCYLKQMIVVLSLCVSWTVWCGR